MKDKKIIEYIYIYRLKPILLILINVFFVNSSTAFPFQFRRIIFYEGNKVIKTVDLISDYHEAVYQLVKRPSRRQKEYLKPEEKLAFNSTERRLLIALRKLAETKVPIEILWEISRTGYYETIAMPLGINVPLSMHGFYTDYIGYGPHIFEEFNKEPNLSIKVKNADTYRFNELGELRRYKVMNADYLPEQFESLHLRDAIAFIYRLLDTDKSKASEDLKAVNEGQFKKYYNSLDKYWTNFKENEVQPIANYFNQFLSKNPDMTLGEYRQLISRLPLDIQDKIDDIADAEFIIKSFSSDNPHTIIYAGGSHCNAVSQLLKSIRKGFGATEVIDIGIDGHELPTGRNKKFLNVFLTPDAWTYLEEDPQRSLMRYKHDNERPLVNSANQVMPEFDKLYKEIKNLPGAGNAVDPQLDKEITEKIMNFYAIGKKKGKQVIAKAASKTYIDFLNGFDNDWKRTLLHWAVLKNLPETAAYLIKHGARVLVADNDGKTPLDYAQTEEMKKILQHK